MDVLVEAVFFGYIVFALVLVTLHYLGRELNLENYLITANRLLAFTGGIYSIAILFQLPSDKSLSGLFFDSYWWLFWIPVIAVLLTQLLWIKPIQRNFLGGIFFALILIYPVFQREIIVRTSLHRDFLPSSWVEPFDSWSNRLVQLVIFLGLFVVLYLVLYRRGQMKNFSG
jgi:hypothetical protein